MGENVLDIVISDNLLFRWLIYGFKKYSTRYNFGKKFEVEGQLMVVNNLKAKVIKKQSSTKFMAHSRNAFISAVQNNVGIGTELRKSSTESVLMWDVSPNF